MIRPSESDGVFDSQRQRAKGRPQRTKCSQVSSVVQRYGVRLGHAAVCLCRILARVTSVGSGGQLACMRALLGKGATSQHTAPSITTWSAESMVRTGCCGCMPWCRCSERCSGPCWDLQTTIKISLYSASSTRLCHAMLDDGEPLVGLFHSTAVADNNTRAGVFCEIQGRDARQVRSLALSLPRPITDCRRYRPKSV